MLGVTAKDAVVPVPTARASAIVRGFTASRTTYNRRTFHAFPAWASFPACVSDRFDRAQDNSDIVLIQRK
jgi:hypothetical protein